MVKGSEYIVKGSVALIALRGKRGQGLYAKVSLGDIERVAKYSWTVNENGYASARINNKLVRMHRYVLDYYGELDVDHRNGDRLDQRRSNLRIVNRSTNLSNRKGTRGYYFDSTRGKYTVMFGKTSYGSYDSEEKAKLVVRLLRSGQSYEQIKYGFKYGKR